LGRRRLVPAFCQVSRGVWAAPTGRRSPTNVQPKEAADIVAIAEVATSGRLDLEDLVDVDDDVGVIRLKELEGTGPWAAHYVAPPRSS
jgi:hypothetical protein